MDIQCLQKATQALEARPVADPSGVVLKKSVVTVLTPEVGVHHFGDVANASPSVGSSRTSTIVREGSDTYTLVWSRQTALVPNVFRGVVRLMRKGNPWISASLLLSCFVVTTKVSRNICSVRSQCSHAVQPPM